MHATCVWSCLHFFPYAITSNTAVPPSCVNPVLVAFGVWCAIWWAEGCQVLKSIGIVICVLQFEFLNNDLENEGLQHCTGIVV